MSTTPVNGFVTGTRSGEGRERRINKDAWRRLDPDHTDTKLRELRGKITATREALDKLTRGYEDRWCAILAENGKLPKEGWRHSDDDKPADIEVVFSHRFGPSVAVVPVDPKAPTRSNMGGKFFA